MKVWLTTTEYEIAVITTRCGECYTSSKFDMASSSSYKSIAPAASESLLLFNERSLQYNTFRGEYISDKVTFSHLRRQFSFEPNILAVTNAQDRFSTPYQGFLGLAPPLSLGDRKASILSQAKEASLIDHEVFSLYTNLNKDI